MKSQQLCELLLKISEKIEKNKQYLTELDAEIGDADHGINMARGFAQIKADCASYSELSCGEILTSAGKTLIRVVAGSSGPLYGSMFKQLGKAVGENELTYSGFIDGFGKGIEKIMALGGAKEGEKTMLDAMCPALAALSAEDDVKIGFESAVNAAEKATENTKNYIATKGRASYVGERSIGHIDPGAQSFSIILRTVYEFIK